MIRSDAQVVWRPGRIYIPVWQFQGIQQVALDGNAANVDTVLISAGTTAAPLTEVNGTGNMGLLMNTDGMEVNHTMQLPYDFDSKFPLYVRVHWVSGSADVADTVAWIVRYLKIVPNVTALISAATALDTTIAVDTQPVATAYTWAVTEWGAIDPRVTAIADTVELIEWEVEMDTKDSDMSEALLLMGLELRYTPKRLWGADGMQHEAKAMTTLLGKTSAN
jgi:hypothetical protein